MGWTTNIPTAIVVTMNARNAGSSAQNAVEMDGVLSVMILLTLIRFISQTEQSRNARIVMDQDWLKT